LFLISKLRVANSLYGLVA